jgi:hypothetical protein
MRLSPDVKVPEAQILALLRARRSFERRGEVASPTIYLNHAEKLLRRMLRAAGEDDRKFSATFDDHTDLAKLSDGGVWTLFLQASQAPLRQPGFDGWDACFWMRAVSSPSHRDIGQTPIYSLVDLLDERRYRRAIDSVRYLLAHPAARASEVQASAEGFCRALDAAKHIRAVTVRAMRTSAKLAKPIASS